MNSLKFYHVRKSDYPNIIGKFIPYSQDILLIESWKEQQKRKYKFLISLIVILTLITIPLFIINIQNFNIINYIFGLFAVTVMLIIAFIYIKRLKDSSFWEIEYSSYGKAKGKLYDSHREWHYVKVQVKEYIINARCESKTYHNIKQNDVVFIFYVKGLDELWAFKSNVQEKTSFEII